MVTSGLRFVPRSENFTSTLVKPTCSVAALAGARGTTDHGDPVHAKSASDAGLACCFGPFGV